MLALLLVGYELWWNSYYGVEECSSVDQWLLSYLCLRPEACFKSQHLISLEVNATLCETPVLASAFQYWMKFDISSLLNVDGRWSMETHIMSSTFGTGCRRWSIPIFYLILLFRILIYSFYIFLSYSFYLLPYLLRSLEWLDVHQIHILCFYFPERRKRHFFSPAIVLFSM